MYNHISPTYISNISHIYDYELSFTKVKGLTLLALIASPVTSDHCSCTIKSSHYNGKRDFFETMVGYSHYFGTQTQIFSNAIKCLLYDTDNRWPSNESTKH